MITVTTNAGIVAQQWRGAAEQQIRRASVIAVTRTAVQVKADVRATLPKVFDRPTPWTLGSLYVAPATFGQAVPEARVWIKDEGGGKGVAPTKYLLPEIAGGTRGFKRSEVALQRAGFLRAGEQIVPAAGAALDAYGNVSRGLIVQLLSYFRAFGEQGYRANMTDRRRGRLARRGRSAEGFVRIGGVEYFISRGPGLWYGRVQHLPAGIWARRGIHGSDVQPVLLFVRRAGYRPRLDFFGIAERVVHRRLPAEFARAMG